MIRAPSDNPRLLTRLVILDSDGIFAYVFEPHVLECAVAIAVDTLCLVLADDHVSQRRACV